MTKNNIKENIGILIIGIVICSLIILTIIGVAINNKPQITYEYYINDMKSAIPSGTYQSYSCDNDITLEYNSDTKEFSYNNLTKDSTCKIYYTSSAGNYIYDIGTYDTGVAINNKTFQDADGVVRYYGENANNYVYFNCKDYGNQNSDTCDIYRIIYSIKSSEEDGSKYYLKITPNNSLTINDIRLFSWDNDHENGSSTFLNSTIYKLLNEGFYTGSSAYSYVDKDNNNYTFNFSNIGLKNDKTRNMLTNKMFKMSKIVGSDYTVGATAANELNGENLNISIGILSISDYLLSKGNNCNSILLYDAYKCTNKTYISNEDGLWTMNYYDENKVYRFSNFEDLSNVYPTVKYQVYPTMYIDSDVKIVYGDGTIDNPYKLILE